jgi:hypothetical protein
MSNKRDNDRDDARTFCLSCVVDDQKTLLELIDEFLRIDPRAKIEIVPFDKLDGPLEETGELFE